jgi:hypothetical protein
LEGLLRTHGIDPMEGSGGMQAGPSTLHKEARTPTIETTTNVSVGTSGPSILELERLNLEDWPNNHLVSRRETFWTSSSLSL